MPSCSTLKRKSNMPIEQIEQWRCVGFSKIVTFCNGYELRQRYRTEGPSRPSLLRASVVLSCIPHVFRNSRFIQIFRSQCLSKTGMSYYMNAFPFDSMDEAFTVLGSVDALTKEHCRFLFSRLGRH